MVLVRCAIVGDDRVFTINVGGKNSLAWLRGLMPKHVDLPCAALHLELYQARQFGMAGNAFLTTKHLDYVELSCGNEQMKAMYLTKEMRMNSFERIKDYIRVNSAPEAIHVLVKIPTPEEVEVIRRRMFGERPKSPSESKKPQEACATDSIWTTISRSVAGWFATAPHEKKNE